MTQAIQPPVAQAQMMIRRPVHEVFEAIVDPGITSHFWFSKGSGRLEAGKRVTWLWEMYGVSAEVDVKAVDANKRVLIEWNGPANPTSVEWTLEALASDRTLVKVRNWGFRGVPDRMVADALDSTSGFTFMLAGLKAWLEHGIEPNLVADHDPAAHVEARGAHGVTA
jgi:uncharacterized protein YndB with AHSA1/START domain